MYRVLVLRNKLPFELKTDCQKAIEYFSPRLPFPITYEFKEVDIPVGIKPYKEVQGFNPITGLPQLIKYYGLIDSVKDQCRNFVKNGDYQAVVFAWNIDALSTPIDGAITSFTNYLPLFYEGTEFIQLAVNQYIKNTGEIWKRLTHENVHAFAYNITRGTTLVLDEMDLTKDGIAFKENDNPLSLTGNYALTLKNLKPYLSQLIPSQLYKPKNFTLKELVSPKTLAQFGEKAWEFLDERMLRNLQFIRDSLGKPITVNNGTTLQHRCFDAVEFRKEGYSQHNHGRAVDFDVQGMTAEQVRQWIIANQLKFPESDMWVELGTNWVHIDTRYSDKKGVYLFNP